MWLDEVARPTYRDGQYLGALDFVAEQDYQTSMRRRLSIGQHTWGIYHGLRLREVAREGSPNTVDVFVDPGLATDGYAREIVVFYPYALDVVAFQQPQIGGAQWVQVWIAHVAQPAMPPRPGYERCEDPDLTYRSLESFRVVVGPQPKPRDALVLAGREMAEADLPPDLSVPAQALPDEEERRRWLLPIGWVKWNGADGWTKTTAAERAQVDSGRIYGGSVADRLLSESGNIVLADRHHTPPGAADPGVLVDVRGSLNVERQAGIGTAAVDTTALSVRALGARQAVLRVEDPNGAEIWSVGANVDAKAGLSVVETGTAVPRLFVRRGGRVGVGTATPTRPLSIRAEGQNEELLSFETVGGLTKWHVNQKLAGVSGLNFAETSVADGRLFLAAGGNVGVGVTDPKARLDVLGGDLRWGANSRLSTEQGGSLELGGSANVPGAGTPFVDFHFAGLTQDFNTRVINDADGQLSVVARRLRVSDEVAVAGRIGSLGKSPAPAHPGWGGGVHTWDVEADASVWAGAQYLLGPVATAVRIPVDVKVGTIEPGPIVVTIFNTSGNFTFDVESRLPVIESAQATVGFANVETPDGAQWGLWVTNAAKIGPKRATVTVHWECGTPGASLHRINYVVVFTPGL
ncbi:hypothetical protein [Mycolicibacterium sp. CR10]|uniref:hypothetical protein n=1 Tax=Mycolicibacterium sp. CR10 TaxID=2562314 RepID=UPI0010C11B47|nr:hypothetical protein [Mycolicibacterium sp. CR10]